MKLIFTLVLTAFTVYQNRGLHRHRHEKKFPQGSETLQKDACIGPKPGVEHNRFFPEYFQVYWRSQAWIRLSDSGHFYSTTYV